jgi:CubicO group peptidase (beta-lactamase class C family)
MKFIIRIALFTLIALAILQPAIIFQAYAEEGGRSSIDEHLKENVAKYHIPGMAVMEVDSEEVIFQGIYGNCSSVDQAFIIGSLSKSFTAVAIMQLSENGSLDIDDSVSKYIDCGEWFDAGTDYERITVRDLLNQTSGIPTYAKLGDLDSGSSYGTHMYANANYGLLGMIIENVSGVPYEEYLKKNIFEPLGMTHSYGSCTEEMQNNLIQGFRNYYGFWIAGAPDYPGSLCKGQWTNVPAGYLASSASDMGKYLQMYLRGGENILETDSIDKMFYENVPNGEGAYYGMGWEYVEGSGGERILQHTGLVENYCALMYIRPDQDRAGIVLLNMNDYLVDNMYLSNIVAPLTGMEADDQSQMYGVLHFVIDLILVCIMLIAVYPIVTIRRWMIGKKKVILDLVRHTMLPILLIVPIQFVVPMFVVRLFVKDVWIIIITASSLLILAGIYKWGYILCKRIQE